MNQGRRLDTTLSVAAFLALGAIAAQAATPGRLFSLGERLDRAPYGAEHGYRAEVDLRQLDFAERLELGLPDGRFAVADLDRLDRRGGGDLLWTGRTAAGEEVVLTVAGGRWSGPSLASSPAIRWVVTIRFIAVDQAVAVLTSPFVSC